MAIGVLKRYPKKDGDCHPCLDGTANVTRDGVAYVSQNIPSGGAATIDVISAVSGGWNPPSDWGWEAVDAMVSDGDNAFAGIFACYPNINNSVAFMATFTGTAVIDWGDGSAPEAVTSATLIEHTFNYAGITQAITSWGFKPCRVKFIVSGGTCSIMNFWLRNSLDKQSSSSQWMALKVRSTFTGATPFQYLGATQCMPHNLHLLDLGTTNEVRAYGFLYNHKALQKLIYDFGLSDGIVAATSLGSEACIYNVDWNSYNWDGWTTLNWAFFNIKSGIPYALDIDVTACQSIASTFRQASVFSSVKLINSGNITDISDAIFNNSSIMDFEMDDASSVTISNNFTYSIVNNLKRLIMTGLTRGVDLTNCMMQTAEIDAFFTSLGTAAGAQTIIVTGNPGAATCDTTIATAKGFTVTT